MAKNKKTENDLTELYQNQKYGNQYGNQQLYNKYNCPYWHMLNDVQKVNYNNLRPKWNPLILLTILLAFLGIVIIIVYTVYKNQKINEFNQWFYTQCGFTHNT